MRLPQYRQLILGATYCLLILHAACAAPQPAIDRFDVVAEFSLIESSGKPFTLSNLKGRISVVDFIFTSCLGVCPTMTGEMKALQDRLPKEIQLVSISVDPEHDTPEVLAAYGRAHGADPQRWAFLTGDREAVHRLSQDSFKLLVDPEGGSAAEPIVHSTRFVLVDRDAVIRGYYDSTEREALDRLVRDAEALNKQ